MLQRSNDFLAISTLHHIVHSVEENGCHQVPQYQKDRHSAIKGNQVQIPVPLSDPVCQQIGNLQEYDIYNDEIKMLDPSLSS